MHLSLRVFGVGRTSGAWGVENNILGVDSDGFWGRKSHLNRVLQVCCIFFDQRHNIQGYPDEIREAAQLMGVFLGTPLILATCLACGRLVQAGMALQMAMCYLRI